MSTGHACAALPRRSSPNAHQLASQASTIAAYIWQPSASSSTSYTPNNLNQYASVGGVAYSYDLNGNLTGDGTWLYSYDAENRLLSAGKTGQSSAYAYDPLGRRISKAITSGGAIWGAFTWGTANWGASGTTATTFFLNSATDEIAEYDGSGALTTRYVPGPAIDEPIATVTAAGTHSWFHTDRQGSVIATSDASGNQAEGPYTYDSYGNCFSGASPCSSGTPWRYTGRRFDAETGLFYYRARYYSAALGRFLQTDPVGYEAGLNLYAYVGNDPTDKLIPQEGIAFRRTAQRHAMCSKQVAAYPRKFHSQHRKVSAEGRAAPLFPSTITILTRRTTNPTSRFSSRS